MSTLKTIGKSWKLPLIALIGIGFAAGSVLSAPKSPNHSPLVTPPQSGYENAIAGIGVVEPKSEVISVGTELPGIIREVHVKVGDKVTQDTPLFSLDERDIDAEITVLQSSLNTAEVQLADADAQFGIVEGIEDKRAIAKDDFNRRKFSKKIAAARVEEIRAKLYQAIITKERMTIKAPIDGQILEVNVRPGEYANIGEMATPLMMIGDMDTVHVRVEIDEENAARVRPESAAKAMVRGKPQIAHPLTFVRFESYVRPKQNLAVAGQRVDTRVLRVIYALPQTEERLFVGQQMDVFIEEKVKAE